MTRYRVAISVFALVGAVLGAALGFLLAPHPNRYTATANVAFVPAPNLTTAEASSFWEVLTRGQVSRTGAVIYDDPRWLPSAANAAKTRPSELSLTAAALSETTMVAITVVANSPAAAESALNDVLTNATPEVTALVAPFVVTVIWPPKDNAAPVPVPANRQVAAAGGLGGLLAGTALGWYIVRRRNGVATGKFGQGEILDQEARLPS